MCTIDKVCRLISFQVFVRYAAPVTMTPMCIAADADQRHPVFQPGQSERCRVLQASHAHSRAQWSWEDGENKNLQRITGLGLLQLFLSGPLTSAALLLMQTIIECLKQACTGELPPNTRNGQSFVHDPKACLRCCFCQFSTGTLQHEASMSCALQVAGETEVKAQIKLRFRTATSQPVVVIRTFQARNKSARYPPIHT